MSFSNRLKEARLKAGMTQEFLALQIGVAKSTLTGYEKGYREPDMDKISKIMDVLKVSANFLFQDEIIQNEEMSLTLKEREILQIYRSLDEFGKHAIELLLQAEQLRCNSQNDPSFAGIKLPYLGNCTNSDLIAFFENNKLISFEYMTLTKNFENSDFIIKINDDSVDPVYFKNDLVCIQKVTCLNYGEIGLFLLNKKIYIRQYGKNCLISINKKYDNIHIESTDELEVIGKVNSKAE